MKRHMKWRLRVFLSRSGLWGISEQLRLLWSFFARKPHEADFELFSRWEGREGLFVDVGANIGQSAVAFRIFNRSFKILSLEPNPALAWRLRFLKAVLGRRFEFRSIGLGEHAESRTIYVPVVDGVALTQEGSALLEVLKTNALTHERIRETTGQSEFEIRETQMKIARMDDLGLSPALMKIDVQGLELSVLRGMPETLRRSHPVLLIENMPRMEEVTAYLKPFSYDGPFAYRSQKNLLVPSTGMDLNSFYMPETLATEWEDRGWLQFESERRDA